MAVIIAEACQNHNGDRKILREMIHAAADAGADYVKIQSMLADELPRRERFENGVVENGVTKAIKRPWKVEHDRLAPMDVTDEAHLWFVDECKSAGIKPLTTVFTRKRLGFVSKLPWEDVKVASYDCASAPFLRELAARFRHLYVSTGATYDEEIEQAARVLKAAGRTFTFLHCVTIYPTPLHEMHLARMRWLATLAPSVGFSDHSLVERDGLQASIAALALGADVVERHFTVLPRTATKDGPVSIGPTELRELVEHARTPRDELLAHAKKTIPAFGAMMGQERRPLSDAEVLNRDYYRGRFASRVGDRWVYNWEEGPVE